MKSVSCALLDCETCLVETWQGILLVFWLGFLTSCLTCFSSLVKVTSCLWAGTFSLEMGTFFYHLQILFWVETCP